MKRLLSNCLLCLMIATVPFSAQAQEKQQGLFWKISGNGLAENSYLLGTIHIFCDGQISLSPAIEKAIQASKEVVLEAKTEGDGGEENIQAMLMRGDTSLDMLLSELEYAELDSLFTMRTGVPISIFTKFKPIMTSAMMLIKMMPCSPENLSGIEQLVQAKAKKDSISVGELEGAAYQLSLLDSLSLKEQASSLLQLSRDFEKQKKLLASMISAYKKGDLSELNRLLESEPDMISMSNLLLVNRNLAWIPKMETRMKNQATFFAVGAGHLPGKTGLIQLLRDAGYEVSPMP